MICLGKSKVLISSHLSRVILLSWYSQVYCGLMLFNVIPIWEGNFLTLLALCPLQGGGNQELRQDPVKSPLPCLGPPTPPPPTPEGMADDRCLTNLFFPPSRFSLLSSSLSLCSLPHFAPTASRKKKSSEKNSLRFERNAKHQGSLKITRVNFTRRRTEVNQALIG